MIASYASFSSGASIEPVSLLRFTSKGTMTSRLVLFGLLATGCLTLVASLDQSKWVVPLVQDPGSSRRQRDLLLGDEDDDFDFFNRQTQDAKEGNPRISFDGSNFRAPPEDSPLPPSVKNSMMKLHLRSREFLDVAQKAAYSAVNLLIAFGKLMEHSNDKFYLIAK
ncbi:uncharacterized protein LOC129769433 [Toxorhynchites rutilus septentrionalis]|uniref:uncharacterized protein LOC129769433 n=1 Tax=Toxorhynchites rutilus septentrionalis TaxID=329112 RepID=UPI002479BCAA|nr:uncharacterized protein LOC129769433 [Toxorhynchites rutilus septentrionalis]